MATKLIPNSVRDVLSYNPETGVFIRTQAHHRSRIGKPTGSVDRTGYVRVEVGGIYYHAHRLAWYFVHNEQPNVIDHINHDRADNRIANLRNVNTSLNGLNLPGAVGVKFQIKRVKGVSYGYWAATYKRQMVYHGKSILLAWHARIMAEREDHPIALPNHHNLRGAL